MYAVYVGQARRQAQAGGRGGGGELPRRGELTRCQASGTGIDKLACKSVS
jgi:hypothetical protein